MEKDLLVAIFLIGFLSVSCFIVYPHERIKSEYIQVIKHRVVDVVQPLCDDVQPETIMIHGLPHTKATPNHRVPCSIMYDGGFD